MSPGPELAPSVKGRKYVEPTPLFRLVALRVEFRNERKGLRVIQLLGESLDANVASSIETSVHPSVVKFHGEVGNAYLFPVKYSRTFSVLLLSALRSGIRSSLGRMCVILVFKRDVSFGG